MRIPISVINYNGSTDTIEMIKSLMKSNEQFDCIIVDNNSPNKNEVEKIISFVKESYLTEFIKDEFTLDTISYCIKAEVGDNAITLIQARDNYGFSKGTNIGIKYALQAYPTCEYIGILNNDTEVTSGFLSNVVSKIKKHNLAAAMGTIIYYGYDKPYIWSIGGYISYISAMGVHVHKGEVYKGCEKDIVYRGFISGCFTVFSVDKLKEIGLLDEDYFFGCEEFQYSVDLCKSNKIAWVPSSIIFHKSKIEEGNGSSHRIAELRWQYNSYMNKIVFINKNKSAIYSFFWHIMFKVYIDIRIRKKYYSRSEYGHEGFHKLRKWLFSNINYGSFKQKDLTLFDSSK